MTKPLAIFGAGGHAKVVLALARALGERVEACYEDPPPRPADQAELLGTPIRAAAELDLERVRLVLGVGDNRGRRDLAARFAGATWATLVHPRAFVDPAATLSPGAVVCAGAVVQPGASLGAHSIVNTSASVDHDCQLGEFVHIAPGCHLSGSVIVEAGAFLGLGTVVTPKRRIGAWAIVGAGAAVVHDLPPGVTAVGVPARPR